MNFVSLRIALIFCTLLSVCSSVFGQLTETDETALSTQLLAHINQLRTEHGLKPLQTDPILEKAAKAHTRYMVKNNVLSHDEKSGQSRSPEKRVRNAGGKSFEVIGENILYHTLPAGPIRKKDLEDLALQLFEQWKNSSPHLENMLHTEYELVGFGFGIHEKEHKLYATNVFARKGYEVPGQLSSNAFGVQNSSSSCDNLIGNQSNIVVNVGNSVAIKDGIIYLYYHNLSLMKQLFDQPGDGIAVDLVLDEQTDCSQPNRLDMSAIYDGIMLKPVYRDELFKSNIAKSPYRLITPIGTVPESLKDVAFTVSLLIIQNGMMCSYTYPVEIPTKMYLPKNVALNWQHPETLSYPTAHIDYSMSHYFDFERGKEQGMMLPADTSLHGKIIAVDIISFSSVEGKTVSNEKLDNDRADFMLSELRKRYPLDKVAVTVNAHENWEKMRFQLDYHGYSDLARQSNDSIKSFLAHNPSAFWDSLLFQQRHSIAILHIGKTSKPALVSEIPTAYTDLRTAIVTHHTDAANQALYNLFQAYDSSEVLFETVVFNALKSDVDLVTNAAGLLTFHYATYNRECAEFLNCWLFRMKELNSEAQYNLLQLYALTSFELTNNWDLAAEHLARVIHPDKIKPWLTVQENPDLILNFSIAALTYFGQINSRPEMDFFFDFINTRMKSTAVTADAITDLVLFYNKWSMYNYTLDFLYPLIDIELFTPDLAFILNATAFANTNFNNETKLEKIMQTAIRFESQRWCQFMHTNAQLKRLPFVKKQYCKLCSEDGK